MKYSKNVCWIRENSISKENERIKRLSRRITIINEIKVNKRLAQPKLKKNPKK